MESGEECDSSEYCVDCVCESGTVSNGTYCLVPGDPIIGTEPKDALIGGIVGGVGGVVVATAVVLIILAKKGKLPVDPIVGQPPVDNSALIGGIVGGVGGAMVVTAVVLIILAKKGKLKKHKKDDHERLNKDGDTLTVYSPIVTVGTPVGGSVVEMRKPKRGTPKPRF